MKNKTLKAILNQFTRGRNLMNVTFVDHAFKNHPKSFKCDTCGKVLDKEQNFKSHIESVHEGKKPYKCDICGKVFHEEQNQEIHIESVHEGKKPYECDICGKVLDEEHNFKSHIDPNHERKKPQKYGFESIWVFYLRCPECEFETKEENNL